MKKKMRKGKSRKKKKKMQSNSWAGRFVTHSGVSNQEVYTIRILRNIIYF